MTFVDQLLLLTENKCRSSKLDLPNATYSDRKCEVKTNHRHCRRLLPTIISRKKFDFTVTCWTHMSLLNDARMVDNITYLLKENYKYFTENKSHKKSYLICK